MPTSETDFSRQLKSAIQLTRVKVYKNNDRSSSGRPDIYVAGGNWIEDKFVDMPGLRGMAGSAVLSHFETLQIQNLNELDEHGDQSFAGVYWYSRNRRHYDYWVLMRWRHFRFVKKWDETSMANLGQQIIPGKHQEALKVSHLFGRQYERNVNLIDFDADWELFCENFPHYIYETDPTEARKNLWKGPSLTEKFHKP